MRLRKIIQPLLSCVGTIGLLCLSGPAQAAETPPANLTLFLGRFHPLLVHLPIGFLLIAFLMEAFSRFPKFAQLKHGTSFVLLLGAISAAVAALLGYLLSLGGGYDKDLLFLHQWLGIGVAVVSVLAYLLKTNARLQQYPVASKAYLPTLALCALVLMGAGHYGGSLTHGSDYLTQYMPPTLRKIAGLPPPPVKVVSKPITNVQEAMVFADIIYPILDNRCMSCHNSSKKKGDLRMDGPDQLKKGGEHGDVFVAGDPEKSEMSKRLMLPEDDEHHMPPEGKTPLTKEQIALIHWWIESGAPFDKMVSQLKVSPEAQKVLISLGAPQPGQPTGIFVQKAPTADPKTVAQLQRQGFQVMTIAQDNHFLQAKFLPVTDTFGAKEMQTLLPLTKQITWLDLSNTRNLSQGMAGLGKLTNLTRLHLENSTVTDADLAQLKGLNNLEYLNLYGTSITDQGLKQLTTLKNLKSLYLWQTKVSPEGIQTLQKQLPNLRVDTGVEPEAKPETTASVQKKAKDGA